MRRAILTLFRSTNFGCVSQALASAEALEGRIVNFVDNERREYYQQRATSPATQMTWNTKFPLSRPVETTEEIETLLNSESDQVFVGSDELLKFSASTQRAAFLHPFPTPFWLSPRVSISKVLWAASIGPVDYRSVRRDVMIEAMARLSDFEFVSVRDEWTWQFIRHGSPELARRAEIVPDPTWLYWPRILFNTPMRFIITTGTANSYHNLIAHLMRGHVVRALRDRRPKTLELAHRFAVHKWDDSRILRQCLEHRAAAWEFLRKATGSSLGTFSA